MGRLPSVKHVSHPIDCLFFCSKISDVEHARYMEKSVGTRLVQLRKEERKESINAIKTVLSNVLVRG